MFPILLTTTATVPAASIATPRIFEKVAAVPTPSVAPIWLLPLPPASVKTVPACVAFVGVGVGVGEQDPEEDGDKEAEARKTERRTLFLASL